MMPEYELAQLNIALMAAPLDSPIFGEFVANLDRINALAEQSPGYLWRLKTDSGNATTIRGFGEEYLVNLSVWKDVESLYNYVYKSAHIEIMSRRNEWFERMRSAYTVLWWVGAGHRPTVAEAKAKLDQLKVAGPTLNAFTFKQPFPQPDLKNTSQLEGFDDRCAAT